jgi:diacylglycerol kinase family enzyme
MTARQRGPVPLLINATAGQGCPADWPAGIEAKFRERGIEARVTLAQNGGQLLAAAKQAVQGGAAIVVAGGGDGTVSAVASCVAGSGA